MSDLLKDVDEMMRQEKLAQIWSRYGNYIIGGVLTLIVAVALESGYQAWFKGTSEHQTTALMAVLAKDDIPAMEKFVGEYKGKNVGALAAILAAQKHMEAKDTQKAAAILLDIRNNAGISKDLRDFATLIWVRLQVDNQTYPVNDLRAALKPLMRDDGAPFIWLATLEDAALMAHRGDDVAGAIKLLTPLVNNPAIPFTLSDRARAMMEVYRVRLSSQKVDPKMVISK